ncbi:DUF805 domain-containing protein [Arenivirga flava]|uniref:DUF805 domain-containing protein n=1 Tax=Arenivirga flava TaxID=1930060 RepID=A0AA37XAY1_9MICO|nr:DUF805 domain-containing protein [Arenivirga flava]GMA27227.1 hypothetical protein GCM10025874_04800 [Arenivirga flava]
MGRMGIVDEIDVRDAPLRGATLAQAMGRFLSHGLRIRGRASRSEYWWWMLVQAAVSLVLVAGVPALLGYGANPVVLSLAGPFATFPVLESTGPEGTTPGLVVAANMLFIALALGTVLPGITVAVRRLHDANFSGLWLLVSGLPLGPFVLALMLLRSSQPEGERFDC